MTKITTRELERDADERLETIVARTDKESVKNKLRNFDRACRHLVLKAKLRLTIPLVRQTYANIANAEIGESTIRNGRGGNNLYQALYRGWEATAVALIAISPPKLVTDAGVIGAHDIQMIENPTLRHQVTLLMVQNRSLCSQLNIMKQSQANVPLRIEGASLGLSNDLILSEAELEAVRDFMDPRRLKAKHLQSTAEGGIKMKDGRRIADPGFLDALAKMVKSYEPR